MTTLPISSQSEPGDMARVREMIWDIRAGLLTTVDRLGHLHTRPVQTLEVGSDDTIWFFTDWSSPKVDELQHDLRVGLGYVDSGKHLYVAVSGTCTVLRDIDKARQIWSFEQRAYYPQGPEDERLAILRVQIERAEYWVAPGRLSYLAAAAKVALTGTPVGHVGENQKVK